MTPWLDDIRFGFGPKLPLILQTEATECGLAALAMVAGFHGHHADLATLRRRFPVSLKGTTLAHLIQVAERLELGTRPLKLELEDLGQLKLPCVLHWELNHFVVLKQVGARGIVVHDPAFGVRKLSLAEASAAFTGVALELWPNPGFQPQEQKPAIALRHLMGRVTGLRRSLGQILLLALALEVFALIAPLFLQWVIDNVIVAGDRGLLTTLALGFGLLLLLQQAVAIMRSWAVIYFNTMLKVQWRANVFAHLLRLPTQYFEKRYLGDVTSRFGAIDPIQRTLSTAFLETLLDGLMTLATLFMMFLYSPALAGVAIGAIVLYALGRYARYYPLRAATEAQIVHAAKQQSHFLESIRGIKAIKLFQRQDQRRAGWLALAVNQINADLRTQKLHLLNRTLNGLLFGIAYLVTIWLGANLVLDDAFSVGMLMAFMAYQGQFGGRVSALIDKLFELKMLQLHGERLADIVLAEPEAPPTGVERTMPLSPSIEVRALHYRYGEHEPHVLDGVDFTIEAGESVAIVGPSGCGKSTLINVLLGVLPPTRGEVRIGGVALADLGADGLRRIAGAVLQDDALFAGSIADNICFFDPQADANWIEECAARADVHRDIAAMPMGYHTLVGDMGAVLSGGQKQRVLLARALYRRPQILFLDEATSHLDVESERRVNAAIKALNITRVTVAHRPETIASAGRVIALSQGKVVQRVPQALPAADRY